MIYAFFNADGLVELACNDDTISELPQGSVELTEAQFANRFNLSLVDGNLVPVVASP